MQNEQLFLEIIRRQNAYHAPPSILRQSFIAGGIILALIIAVALSVVLTTPKPRHFIAVEPGYQLECGEEEDTTEYEHCTAYVKQLFSVER